MEDLIHRDVGRGASGLFAAAKGGLWGAVSALSARPPRYAGILTGFFVPRGDPPAAETDGPAGAALLALAFARMGVPCRVLTDDMCRDACEVALAAAGLPALPVDHGSPGTTIDAWRGHGIDWVVAIERCGVAADGRQYNMRGEALGARAVPLDGVFSAGPWHTIAIGDGGNEVGMGALPIGLIARDVPLGETIACVTPADHLIAAGVSHWGVYALIAGLAAVNGVWRDRLRGVLDPAADARIVAAMVEQGPAVDGVTLRREATIDGISMSGHRAVLEALKALT